MRRPSTNAVFVASVAAGGRSFADRRYQTASMAEQTAPPTEEAKPHFLFAVQLVCFTIAGHHDEKPVRGTQGRARKVFSSCLSELQCGLGVGVRS